TEQAAGHPGGQTRRSGGELLRGKLRLCGAGGGAGHDSATSIIAAMSAEAAKTCFMDHPIWSAQVTGIARSKRSALLVSPVPGCTRRSGHRCKEPSIQR